MFKILISICLFDLGKTFQTIKNLSTRDNLGSSLHLGSEFYSFLAVLWSRYSLHKLLFIHGDIKLHNECRNNKLKYSNLCIHLLNLTLETKWKYL